MSNSNIDEKPVLLRSVASKFLLSTQLDIRLAF